MAGIFKGDPVQEFLAYFRIGTDGVFTDFPDDGAKARKTYDAELTK